MEVLSVTPPQSPITNYSRCSKKKMKNKCPCVINGENCTNKPSLAVGYCK